MTTFFLEASRYMMILLLLSYTVLCFCIYGQKQQDSSGKKLYLCQRMIMFAFHLDAYLVLYFVYCKWTILIFYLIQLAVFLLIYVLYHRYSKVCELVLNNMLMLFIIGMCMLVRLNMSKAIRQFAYFTAGMLLCLIIPLLLKEKSRFRGLTWLYALTGIAGLGSVLVMGITSYGAKLSICIAGITIQPSEFVKIIFVFFVSSMLYQDTSLKRLCCTSVISAIFVLLLVATRDLGGALLYFITYLVIIYVATGKWQYFAAGIGFIGVAFGVCAHLFSHVKIRLISWRDPLSVIDDAGYQICQSLFGIGAGGWFGTGLGRGIPGKIPVVEKDFMFSAISEEFGGIFALCLIGICISQYLMMIQVSHRLRDGFYKLVALGLGCIYMVQILLTVGGAVKFIPSTGVTLPLVSYGGSSLVATLIMFGVIQALYICPDRADHYRACHFHQRAAMIVAGLFLLLYFAMMSYFSVFLFFKKDAFLNNPYNKVQDVMTDRIIRGNIYSSDGAKLAYTKIQPDGTESRIYPYGQLFAHSIGYADMGKTGMELQGNYVLMTSHESLWNRMMNGFAGKKNYGDSLVVTLDSRIQEASYEALKPYTGAVLAMEAHTGRIVAMVSSPAYDPEEILINWEEISSQNDGILVNRATSGKYLPAYDYRNYFNGEIGAFSTDATESLLKIPTSESGEEILIAPLHMAMLFSAVLNNGVLMEPMLMDRVETASEKQVTRFLPQEITHLLSDQECREFILHIGMDDVGVTSAGFSTTGRFEMVNAYQNPRMDCWYYGYATDGTDSLVLIAVFENIDENNMPEQSVLQPIYEAYFQ